MKNKVSGTNCILPQTHILMQLPATSIRGWENNFSTTYCEISIPSFVTSPGPGPKDEWRVWSLMEGNFKLKLSAVMEKLFQMVTSRCSEGDRQPGTHTLLPSCRTLGGDSGSPLSQHWSITVTSYLLVSYKCFYFSRSPTDRALPLRHTYKITFTWGKMQKVANIVI